MSPGFQPSTEIRKGGRSPYYKLATLSCNSSALLVNQDIYNGKNVNEIEFLGMLWRMPGAEARAPTRCPEMIDCSKIDAAQLLSSLKCRHEYSIMKWEMENDTRSVKPNN
ncbi:unnamed protein product [Dovyalis caffra]|uniref:Uncharacterized protein n=1 Tax=Dovyalis caffra TaxID=77055 RepID=A0AAV1R1N5_9ROSI|nr:unnamed protein product [Dovyalis caffra]